MQLLEKSYYDILEEQAAKNSDHEAIVMGNKKFTYGDLLKKVDQLAATLLSRGVKRGDKIALWSGTCPEWFCAYYGIIRSGGTVVILNANLMTKDVKPLVEFADTKFMIYGKTHDIEGTSADAEEIAKIFNLPAENCFSVTEYDFSRASDIKPDTTGWDVRDDAFIIYTSGTTAFPKAVVNSQYGAINIANQLLKAIAPITGEKGLMGAPLFHVYNLFTSGLYMLKGATLYLPEVIKADFIADLIAKEGITDIWSVAPIYQGIIDSPELTKKAAPNIRLCFIGGSYTSPVQLMRFENALYNSKFLDSYGMTEANGAYVVERPEDDVAIRYNTVGRAVDGVEVAVWDEEHGILPPGEVGEIITRGFHVKKSYYKLPPEKQAIDKDGWLHTGDLGIFDEHENLKIVGRIKDLIIKGGENLAPAEIEAQIMSHPSIAACKVFGYKDRIYGENLGACVTLAPGAKFDEDDLRRYAKEKLGSYKSPVYYFVFDDFPLNANRKIDQLALHVEMLRRLHRLLISGKLDKGLQVISVSIKNSTYNITPVATMLEECALNLGFNPKKAAKIRQAVEETLIIFVTEMTEDVGNIDINLFYTHSCLRIIITDSNAVNEDERAEEIKLSSAIVLRLVDDCEKKILGDGKTQIRLDFTYDKDFDIKEFLMQHEPLE
ncbi:MAG: acyl--CoA ligase [Synergistaceae bacterium]|nr:acyl--CoA ligase [Synergistaceae bacterium]